MEFGKNTGYWVGLKPDTKRLQGVFQPFCIRLMINLNAGKENCFLSFFNVLLLEYMSKILWLWITFFDRDHIISDHYHY